MMRVCMLWLLFGTGPGPCSCRSDLALLLPLLILLKQLPLQVDLQHSKGVSIRRCWMQLWMRARIPQVRGARAMGAGMRSVACLSTPGHSPSAG